MKEITKEDQQRLMRQVVLDYLKYEITPVDYIPSKYEALLDEVMRLQDPYYYEFAAKDQQIVDITIYDIINHCYVIHYVESNNYCGLLMLYTRDNRLYGRGNIELTYSDIINSITNGNAMYSNLNEKLNRILSICFDEWNY